MKKFIVLLFASLLVLSACGEKEESSSKDDTKESKEVKKEVKKEDKKESKDKEVSKKVEPKSEEQSTEEVATNEQQSTEEVNSTEQATQEQQPVEQPVEQPAQHSVQQPQYQEDSRGNIVEQPDENGQYTGNELPADFTTEGMSPEAQNKIDSLTRQKDFEGLPQEEYNRQVFEIMNNE